MTKPTQAQIDAGLAVFADHYWDSFNADKFLILQHIKETLPRALTAAAEVKTSPTGETYIDTIEDDEIADEDFAGAAAAEVVEREMYERELLLTPGLRTTAAEVGERPTLVQLKATKELIAIERAATIERCAEWLEDQYPCHRTVAFEMRKALKDKP